MKKSEYLKKLAEYEEHLRQQDAKGSTGSKGKLFEELVRRAIVKKHENADLKVGARPREMHDVFRDGITYEVKTGSGAVRYAVDMYGEPFTKEDMVAENVFPGQDYIVWAPFTQFLNKTNFYDMFWVFSRDEFIDTLEKIGKNGLASSLHLTKKGYQINIQTITPRMEDRLWDILDTMDTLQDLLERLVD